MRRGGLYLPQVGLWLDAHQACRGPEKAFVSHAHSDHTARHRETILTAPTASLMQARTPGKRLEHILDYRQPLALEGGAHPATITLYPAGHILGSAMALVQADGESLLYTGDFKLRQGLSNEVCEPQSARVLIMESTFGRPHYVFPPTAEVLNGVIRFCRETLDNHETPVLLGYSLGKSQELLSGLAGAQLPLMLHDEIWKLTQIYRHFGCVFPEHERFHAGSARGRVLLCPPQAVRAAWFKDLGPARKAIITGWAVDPSCRFRYQCDAAFPLSDHADFPELLEMVRLVNPQTIYIVHGFTAEFAHTLREHGYDARALGQHEQLSLHFGVPSPLGRMSKAGVIGGGALDSAKQIPPAVL
jgi:DNA ligase 1